MRKIYLLLLSFVFSVSFAQSGADVTFDLLETPPMCNPGDCVSTLLNYNVIKETTSYQVQSIPFNLEFPTTGGTVLNDNVDDTWSSIVDIPFTFCFYGQSYNKILVGTNGLITFNIAGQVPGGTENPNVGGDCNWSFTTTIPNTTFPIKNSIYGVYQDTNVTAAVSPSIQNTNFYIVGSAPNRMLIVNFNELPQYSCNTSVGLQTSQIVLHETTNIIDIKIKNRTACTAWNGGRGVVGIQNQAGTVANVPPGRNTGTWSATNEAWRFIPDGNSLTNLIWSINAVEVASNVNPFIVCPNNGDVLQAKVIYTNCENQQVVLQEERTILLDQEMLQVSNANNLTVCAQNGDLGVFDLTLNNSIVLNGLNPQHFSINYFVNQTDANNLTNSIANPQAFSSAGQTVYVSIESLNTGCYKVKQFELFVNTAPPAPTGNAIQTFSQGQTLADLIVSGTNIQWYASATGSDFLPSNTPLVNGVTYYASQTSVTTNCESKMSAPQRLAVTVQDALSISDFDFNSFKAYPNPVKDVLNLSYTKEISKVSVHNLLGQEVLSKSVNAMQSQVDLSRLTVGTYLVKVTVDGLENTIKIVKE